MSYIYSKLINMLVKTEKKELFDELQPYLEFLNAIPNINAGGCGIAAYCLSRMLDEEHDIQSNIIMLFDDGDGISVVNNINGLTNSEINELSSCSHVICESNGVFFDTKGEFSINRLFKSYKYILRCDQEEMHSIIKYGKGWNSEFEREQWIEEIEDFFEFKLNL